MNRVSGDASVYAVVMGKINTLLLVGYVNGVA